MTKAKLFMTAFALFCLTASCSWDVFDYPLKKGKYYVTNDGATTMVSIKDSVNCSYTYMWGIEYGYTYYGTYKIDGNTLITEYRSSTSRRFEIYSCGGEVFLEELE